MAAVVDVQELSVEPKVVEYLEVPERLPISEQSDTTTAQCKPKVIEEETQLVYGICPDLRCNEFILFDANNKTKKVVCNFCSQWHRVSKIHQFSPTYCPESHLMFYRYSMMPKRTGPEWSRVDGISPFLCKLIAPFFTRYGIDIRIGEAKLLTKLDANEIFDAKLLSDRAFIINADDLQTPGYGTDMTGSDQYLATTLKSIKDFNHNFTVLEALHVAGDGSCLVHAVSRALVGREIYWHALRENMFCHLQRSKEWYKKTLKEFLAEDDWDEILKECNANYLPRDHQLGKKFVYPS